MRFRAVPMMRCLLAAMLVLAGACLAQAPVETARPSGETLQRDQIRAGTASRDMQRAEQATRDAEGDYRQAESIHKDTQKRADETRRDVEAAKKKLDAAKAKELQARKAYEAAVNAVGSDGGATKK